MHPQDEELHAELLRLFRKYFEENQQWQADATYASSIRIRHLLTAMHHACIARRKDIRKWQIDKRQQLDERKEKRAAQKGKGSGKK
jgi:hypothetical protein